MATIDRQKFGWRVRIRRKGSLPIAKQFKSKIDAATEDFLNKVQTAPTRGGWDPVFRKRIDSKSQLKRAWMNTVQDLVGVAKVYGYDLSDRFANVEDE